MSRRELLLGAAAAAVTARAWGQGDVAREQPAPTQRDDAKSALAAAVDYLWSKQADDGCWHSPQYGLMRSGQSLTPFVLHALLSTIDVISSDVWGRVQRAGWFMLERLDGEGALGRHDPEVIEYPVYSTAYALKCIERAQSYHEMFAENGTKAISAMRRFLLGAQFDEADGFSEDDPAFGGWGYQQALKRGDSGHMDLAHTRRALEAITRKGFNDEQVRSARTKAQAFLRVVQKHPQAAARPQLPEDGPASNAPPPSFDGGFYFSPIVLDANKGGMEKQPAPHWRSYATATCDGILALLAAGVPRDDERVKAAAAWLMAHGNLAYPEGVPEDVPEQWGAAIHFYHFAVRAEAYRALDWPADERAKLAAVVRKEQLADGSFVNRESPLMKEDDPVLCTALAVVALGNSL